MVESTSDKSRFVKTSATSIPLYVYYILRYMWSDEIKLNRKNGLREAWPDDRLFKYKRFYSEEFDPGSG